MTTKVRVACRLLDVACIGLALSISAWLTLPPELRLMAEATDRDTFFIVFDYYTGASVFTLVSFFLTFYIFDCYSLGREDIRDSSIRVMVAVVAGIVGTGFIFYSLDHWRFPRFMFVLQAVITLCLTLGWRAIYWRFGQAIAVRHERVILLGAGYAGQVRAMLAEYSPTSDILGYSGEPGADEAETGPYLCPPSNLLQTARAMSATKILVIDTLYLEEALARELFDAKMQGLKVEDMRSLYERYTARIPVDFIEDTWLLLEDGFNFNANSTMRRGKRMFDVVFSLSLLILTLPVLLISALCIRLESRGPVFYTQKRVGLGSQEFTVYKLRSMRSDAEQHGAVWAAEKDPRVTRVGRFIRKTRIDELPQLVNVLKGDMSVIGPRPERMEFVRQLEEKLPYYSVRHTIKPGITGWAQVCYPYGASVEDARYKLEYDLYYIKNLSFLLEAKIILKTIGVVIIPSGAR